MSSTSAWSAAVGADCGWRLCLSIFQDTDAVDFRQKLVQSPDPFCCTCYAEIPVAVVELQI